MSLRNEPPFQRVAAKIGQLGKQAFAGKSIKLASHVLGMPLADTLHHQVADIGVKVLDQRRCLVIGHGVFGGGHNAGLDQFGPPLQFAQHFAGGVLVAAAGRDLHHKPVAVAVLRRVGAGGHTDTARLGGLVAGNRRHAGLAFAILPTCQPLAFAHDDFCASRQRFSKCLAVNGAHRSLRFSLGLRFHDQLQPQDWRQFVERCRRQPGRSVHEPRQGGLVNAGRLVNAVAGHAAFLNRPPHGRCDRLGVGYCSGALFRHDAIIGVA
ncbi:MAG TPA: hypothetical protein VNH11_07290 [Pirellulales bacterium]|nr:hypothetical protein [Pirellulales bacterium]